MYIGGPLEGPPVLILGPVPTTTDELKLRYLRLSLGLGLLIAAMKVAAYFLTHSVAILTDAAESGINVLAAGFALYAVWLSAQPPDREHPYGHGKIEFVSAGFEGGFIVFAGLGILYEAYRAIRFPHAPTELGLATVLVALGGAGNGYLGWRLVQAGKRYQSLALVADGRHLLTDAFSSVALLLGLGLMALTGLYWLDGILALLLAAMLLYHGAGLIRQSLRGLLDERDQPLLAEVAAVLQAHRRDTWVDLHNLRAVRHGADIHIDAHVTLPWYQNLEQAQAELEAIQTRLDSHFATRVEVFLHPEPCTPASCPVCPLLSCAVRQAPFERRVDWTSLALQLNQNHAPTASGTP